MSGFASHRCRKAFWLSLCGAAALVSVACGPRSSPIRTGPDRDEPQRAPAAANSSNPLAAPLSVLDVEVASLRSSDGSVFVAVFDSEEAFPNVDEAVRAAQVPIVAGVARARFDDLARGEYAILVLHDENDNGALDKNLIGIPTEGVGASNNAQGRFGPAKYEKARFRLDRASERVEVGVVYFN